MIQVTKPQPEFAKDPSILASKNDNIVKPGRIYNNFKWLVQLESEMKEDGIICEIRSKKIRGVNHYSLWREK